MLINALLSLTAVFMLFALIDLPLQILLFMKQQKMSKQEIKEEYKSTEGRPEIKQRIRQIQMQMAQRGVRKAVPTADVVIVNPEHYAVALKYDEERAEAPFIIARAWTRWRSTSARWRRSTRWTSCRCRRWRAPSTTPPRSTSKFPRRCTERWRKS